MKNNKIKKLLKQIKLLKKLKKSRKAKTFNKSKSKNLLLTAELESLKDKIKNQELQLTQIRNPQSTPISRVNYEVLGIGQQSVLNQSNLENLQKNIEKNIKSETKDLILNQQTDNKYLDVIKGIESGKFKVKQTKFGVQITNPELYKKPGPKPKIKKAIDELISAPAVKNKVNIKGTLQKPIYNDSDNQGQFPVSEFINNIKPFEEPPISQEQMFNEPINQEQIFNDPINQDETIDLNKIVVENKTIDETINQEQKQEEIPKKVRGGKGRTKK
jgi:hypothetical protein